MASNPLKYHGGKQAIACHILPHFPPHRVYCEPFAGGLGLLLARSGEGVCEVVNDIDGELANFWRALSSEFMFGKFLRAVSMIPVSQEHWEIAYNAVTQGEFGDSVARAVSYFVCIRQSLAGRGDTFTPVSTTRLRRGMCEQVAGWLSAVEGLPEAHERLKHVLVLRQDFAEVFKKFKSADCFLYCDPPYLGSTRKASKVYRCEMQEADHVRLLAAAKATQAKVMISGYPSGLYDIALSGWRTVDIAVKNHAAGGAEKRTMTERLWMNY